MPAAAYLDHNATSPLRPAALDAMVEALRAGGNPSSVHGVGRKARAIVDKARREVAAVVGARPADAIFTSGGTEANNLALSGAGCARVLVSAIEHDSVRRVVPNAEILPVDGDGVLDLGALERALAASVEPALVSVMLANNETGVVQDLDAVAQVVRSHEPEVPRVPLHTDAVQAAAWLDLGTAAAAADLISVSGHKLGGPKGVGVLVVRQHTPIRAMVLGGGQERGRRSGTSNVAGIVGMAAALEATVAGRATTNARVGALRDRLADGLLAAVPGAVECAVDQGDRSGLVPGICHLCIEGVDAETLLFLLESEGVVASAASSCSSGAQQASHVLAAMGVSESLARGSLRLSLGWDSTDADVDTALRAVPAAVRRVREFG